MFKKLDEVKRNELLAKSKMQTKTRYEKSSQYLGFSVTNLELRDILTKNIIIIYTNVGKYEDIIQIEDVIYWIQIEAEYRHNRQVNTQAITSALAEAIDNMDIKVDCSCPDFKYRFAAMATAGQYKYGQPENRPANITNPHSYGGLCKHLIGLLRDKKWLSRIVPRVMKYVEDNIEQINVFLGLEGDKVLTLPNSLARYNGRMGGYAKMFDKQQKEQEETEDEV